MADEIKDKGGWDHLLDEDSPITFEGEILREFQTKIDEVEQPVYQVKFSDGVTEYVPKRFVLCSLEEVSQTKRIVLNAGYAKSKGWV